MSAIDLKPESNSCTQSALGNRLLKVVQIVCAQVGETPASFIDWLTNEGGLTKMVLLYFTKHLALQNAAFGIAARPNQAMLIDWLIEENSIYRLNEQGHHCDEITVGMANGSCEQIMQNIAAQKLHGILTGRLTVLDRNDMNRHESYVSTKGIYPVQAEDALLESIANKHTNLRNPTAFARNRWGSAGHGNVLAALQELQAIWKLNMDAAVQAERVAALDEAKSAVDVQWLSEHNRRLVKHAIDRLKSQRGAPEQQSDIAAPSYKHTSKAAVYALGLINEALGIDPDEAGGAGPILDAIEKLKTLRSRPVSNHQVAPAKAVTITADEIKWLARKYQTEITTKGLEPQVLERLIGHVLALASTPSEPKNG